MRAVFVWWVPLLLAAAPVAAQRVEVPIKAVTLSDGVRRYAVTVTIDGTLIDAGLDTGSTGLRVLAAALPRGPSRRGIAVRYGYGSGIEFSGTAVPVGLAIGTLVGDKVRVERIDKVGCIARRPDCTDARGEGAAYRIQGDGLPNEGFEAIMGIGLRDDPVGNPLEALGTKRWIVDLPKPGDARPGRLILNPSEQEVARYRQFSFLRDTNQVTGCIVAGTTRLCAPAMIDTGAIGLRVQGGKPEQILASGTPAVLMVGDDKGQLTMPVTIGRRDQASGMRLYPARRSGELSLSFGIAPYLYWSVFYDAERRRIGFADR